MACLNCYACETGEPNLPHIIGTKKEPLGSCINCQAFACGHHAFRDRASCRFECVMCYPALLAASAGSVAALENRDLNQEVLYRLIILHYPRRPSREVIEFPYVYSIEEFYERYPFYRELLQEKLISTKVDWDKIENRELAETLKLFPDTAKKMLHAAAVLVKDKENKQYYPVIIIEIAEGIKRKNEGDSNVWY
jgi:hypothetical protein